MSTRNAMSEDQGGPILYALKDAERRGVELVVWKNRKRIQESLAGGFNIDIFVPEICKSEFEGVMSRWGFFEADSSSKKVAGVTHYFRLGCGDPFHIHVYYRLVTGESALKEFDLPIGEYLVANTCRDSTTGLKVVNDQAACYLFLLRHYLKSGSFLGRREYKRKVLEEKQDFGVDDHLLETIEIDSDPLDVVPCFHRSEFISGSIPERISSLRVKWRLRKHLRRSGSYFLIKRNYPIALRFLGLLRFKKKRKKKIVPFGQVIAITGAEATGKSTIIGLLANKLGIQFDLVQAHTGKPPVIAARLISSLAKIVKHGRVAIKSDVTKRAEESSRKVKPKNAGAVTDFIAIIKSLEVAFSRLLLTRSLVKKAKRGALVVTDRWPSMEMGKMDGPRIDPSSGWFEFVASKVEVWIYQRIPRSDFCLIFSVPLSLALQRNEGRIKEGKETPQQVVERHKVNEFCAPKSKKHVCYRNDCEIEKTICDVMELISFHLSEGVCRDAERRL